MERQPGLLPSFAEPASFRDRNNRVFYCQGQVFRGISKQALANWDALCATKFLNARINQGTIVDTQRVSNPEQLDPTLTKGWPAILWHETIPFITYPYEWCFGMLQDAAILTLLLLVDALQENMVMKDASAYNIQWRGPQPVFIDITSFEKLVPGQPWEGYRQFCQMFLYPLMLQAYKDIPFQPWLRGSLDGIEPATCARLMSMRDWMKPGVFMHVYVQAKMEAAYAQQKVSKKAIKEAGFSDKMISGNALRLIKIVDEMRWMRFQSEWSHYTKTHSYTEPDLDAKRQFVRTVIQTKPWNQVWDLGCNTGEFSRIAAENKENYVLAMDADPLVVEQLYREVKQEQIPNILPLVINLADPSPRLGWRGVERKSLLDRGKPNLILCLALIHHMVIRHNIPMAEFVEWLRSLDGTLIIEFVSREDPMVQKLLMNKNESYPDYTQAHFEQCLSNSHFRIHYQQPLQSGTRFMYYAIPQR